MSIEKNSSFSLEKRSKTDKTCTEKTRSFKLTILFAIISSIDVRFEISATKID